MNKKLISVSAIALFIAFIFLISSSKANALSFNDIINGAKSFVLGGEKKELKIDSNIALAPQGDVDKNGQIDAGDIVRFSYTITNTTDKQYTFGTLKTNIDRKQFNFFHNLRGTTNLVDDNKTINIVNVRLNFGETLIISFDARTLYRKDDTSIDTEAEFIDSNKNSIVKSVKIEKLVKKNVPSFISGEKLEKKEQ